MHAVHHLRHQCIIIIPITPTKAHRPPVVALDAPPCIPNKLPLLPELPCAADVGAAVADGVGVGGTVEVSVCKPGEDVACKIATTAMVEVVGTTVAVTGTILTTLPLVVSMPCVARLVFVSAAMPLASAMGGIGEPLSLQMGARAERTIKAVDDESQVTS